MTSEERPPKRQKQEQDDDLQAILLGESISDDEEAEKRRLKRRQRWKMQLQPDDTDMPPSDTAAQERTNEIEEAATTTFDSNVLFETAQSKDGDDDGFDMFSSSVSPPKPTETTAAATTKNDDYDDEEGYYKPVLGETIECGSSHYKVLGIVGKGVFSTVLKGKSDDDKEVALKLIRNNETMAKAAQTEIEILQKLPPHSHVVQLLHSPGEHYNHVVMVFDYQRYNLRDVLSKFGRGVGISLQSVQIYFYQLLSALQHLEKHGVIHSDLKPDNILVSEDFSTLQLCDFGSAFLVDSNNIPTPYLVSRYYRAPEIILGSVATSKVDLWSAGVTVAELFLGNVLFAGKSNNDMLQSMMQALGPLSSKQVKQHTLVCNTHNLPRHFQGQYFLQSCQDKVTGAQLSKQVLLETSFPTTTLQSLLLKSKSASDSRVKVLQFADLLRKCLALDPTRRIDLRDAMQHEFFRKEKNKEAA